MTPGSPHGSDRSDGTSPGTPQDRPWQDQPSQSSASPGVDPELLHRVVQQTLSAADAVSVDSIDMQRLKSVAHRRRGQPLTLEPVAVELVRALLGPDFAGLKDDPELFLAMSAQVARTLMEDPVAGRRLAELWARLNEAGQARP